MLLWRFKTLVYLGVNASNSASRQLFFCEDQPIRLIDLYLQDEEVEGSGAGSDRDSDMEFEQMLADAEDVPPTENNTKPEETNTEVPADPPVRRKAKTKIGNKTKKKKKAKTASKFPDGEVNISALVNFNFCKRCIDRNLLTHSYCFHRLITKTIVKCVSKAERLFYVIPVLELIILFVWNLNWRRHPKGNGVVHIARTMV